MSTAMAKIEVRHLRYFLAVFEELHFGRAAKRLHIAQPPLSRAIRQLEGELGVELFERSNRGVSTTGAGDLFAEEARNVLARIEFAVVRARLAAEGRAAVRIGCAPLVPIDQLYELLAAMRRHDGRLDAQVAYSYGPTQVQRLQAGALDLGIFHLVEGHDELETEPLFPGERLHAFLPKKHPLAARRVLGPEDVRDDALVLFPRAANPELYDRVLASIEDAGFRFRSVTEASGVDPRNVMLAVAGGMGIAFASFMAKVSEAARLIVRRPLSPEVSMPDLALAWRADTRGPLQEHISVLREIARALHGAPVPV
jgi:DNA-binding transcriptional LysR family regulator